MPAKILEEVTQGTILHSIAVSSFCVMETAHGPGDQLSRHAHEKASLNIILDGGVVESLSTGMVHAGPGMGVVKPAGSYHSNSYGRRGARSILIEVLRPGPHLGTCDDVFAEFREITSAEMAGISRRIQREIRLPDESSSLIVEGLVLQVIGLVGRQRAALHTGSIPAWVCRVRDRLEAGFVPGQTLELLAGDEGIDVGQLERTFRQHYGMGLGERLRMSRLEWSARQLRATDVAVGKIAMRAGFYDQSHFTRHFRRTFGMPPARYRSATRADQALLADPSSHASSRPG